MPAGTDTKPIKTVVKTFSTIAISMRYHVGAAALNYHSAHGFGTSFT
jgi:hypothetical protein